VEATVTSAESNQIEKLRKEIHQYHEQVISGFARCESCRSDIQQIKMDIYGLPGNKETSPGLMGEVAELKRGRRMISMALRGAWALLTILFGTVATTLLNR
jgi:hypothetical protein